MKKILLASAILCSSACFQRADQGTDFKPATIPTTPYIKIKTNERIHDEPKIKGSLEIFENGKLVKTLTINIEKRGATSQMFYPKKSYGFELDSAFSFLGMPRNKNWVLHAPFGDKTLTRNALAYDISNSIGKYAAKNRFVEVEVNGSFMGTYVLMEKLTQDADRINIDKDGFIVKIDKNVGHGGDQQDYNDQNSFRSKFDENGRLTKKSKTHFLYHYPKAKKITKDQKADIQAAMASFEDKLVKGDLSGLDQDSFIDFFILTELFQNHDGYRISTFITKDINKNIAMGPIWDIDIAFGSDAGFCDGMNRHAWVFQYNKYCGGDDWLVPFWWTSLLNNEAFKAKLDARWTALRKAELSNSALENQVNIKHTYLKDNLLADRNFKKWRILDEEITPNRSTGSHDAEMDRLKTWLLAHAAWIDTELKKL